MVGFVDDILTARRAPSLSRSWPVGVGSVNPWDATRGHDQSEFSPESYGDYLATSAEIHAVASLRARLMSTLRLRLYLGDDESKKSMHDHPSAQLLRYVNPFWTPRRLARMDELSHCVWGQSFWAIERQRGKPAEIWWCKPGRMLPKPDESSYIGGWLYEPILGGPVIPFDADEVMWFRYPNPLDEFAPLSPLAAARLAADAAKAMMTSNRNMFSNGLQIAGLVTPMDNQPMFSEAQVDELDSFMRRRLSGADKAHKWAILRYAAQFRQMSVSPKDAEFVSGLSLTLRQVCNAYGVPLPLMNDMMGATATSVDAFIKALWAHTLVPDSQLQAEEVEEQFLPLFGRGAPDHAEHDYGSIPALQEAASEVWTREAQMIDRGLLTGNEWRARYGYAAVDWLEKPWLPLNKAQPGDDGQLVMPGTDPRLQRAIDEELAKYGEPGDAGGEATMDEVAALPDDERNPVNQPPSPRGWLAPVADGAIDHMAARSLLAALTPAHVNGHRR